MTHSYDIVVLGGGIGGYTAAIRAAQLGKTVAIVEKAQLGGVCLHKGCIPSKALLRSAEVFTTIKNSRAYGIEAGDVALDFTRVQERKNNIVAQLHRGVQSLMKKHKIEVYYGTGRLAAPSIFSPRTGMVAVELADGESVTLMNEHLILATGSRPKMLPGLEADGRIVLTSDEALELSTLPVELAIIGGGIIGVEWASMMTDFGVNVTIIEAADRILPTEDLEVSREMAMALKKRGVTIITEAKLVSDSVVKEDEGVGAAVSQVRFEIERPDGNQQLTAEKMLLAVGRTPNTAGLGLESTDLAMNGASVRVNGWLQTSQPHIYAIGDLAGGAMAHAASRQAVIAVEHICGLPVSSFDMDAVPRCVFSHPEAASIGLTESEAKKAGMKVKSAKVRFGAIGKAVVQGDPTGFVKIVMDEATQDIIGVHMVGAKVTDLIAEASLAKLLEATPWEIGAAIHPHPTLSEALSEACLAVDDRFREVVR